MSGKQKGHGKFCHEEKSGGSSSTFSFGGKVTCESNCLDLCAGSIDNKEEEEREVTEESSEEIKWNEKQEIEMFKNKKVEDDEANIECFEMPNSATNGYSCMTFFKKKKYSLKKTCCLG